jgi:hypothetical protein
MQITLELPEDIAQGLESKWKDLPRVKRFSHARRHHTDTVMHRHFLIRRI